MPSQPPEHWHPPSPSTAGWPQPTPLHWEPSFIQRHPGYAGTGRACGSKALGTEHG